MIFLTKYKETEIGRIPEEWEMLKLSDLTFKITKGTTPTTLGGKFVKKGINFIKVESINDNGTINQEKVMFIDEETNTILARSKLKKNDILYTIAGTIGKVSIVTDSMLPANTNQAVAILRPDLSKIDLQYLHYVLVNPEVKRYLLSKVVHAVQPNLSLTEIGNCPVPMPNAQEQKAIAKILSDLDSKIEINSQMNATLESMTKATFKHWFIDFEFPDENGKPYKSSGGKMVDSELGKIPEGWSISKIGKELCTVLGGTPSTNKKEYWTNGTVPWINSGKINEFRIIEPVAYITEAALNDSATKFMPRSTTVIAITGATLGQVSMIESEMCGNQSVIGIVENQKISSEYIYLFIKSSIGELILNQTGGAQQHINKENVDNFGLLIPPNHIMKQFIRTVKPIFNQISNNCFESLNLSKSRDFLLPKLMSGQIRVPIEAIKNA